MRARCGNCHLPAAAYHLVVFGLAVGWFTKYITLSFDLVGQVVNIQRLTKVISRKLSVDIVNYVKYDK